MHILPTEIPHETTQRRFAARRSDADSAVVDAEHSILLRRLARLQDLGDRLAQCERRVRQLESENLLLRGHQLVVRTALLWGLRYDVRLWPSRVGARPATPPQPASREAHSVICQTGCVGHAHPWLDGDGHCKRSGRACERLASDAGDGVMRDGAQRA